MADLILGADIALNIDNDVELNFNNDFNINDGQSNLVQAILNRFRTDVNELTLHLEYGSELTGIMGNRNKSIVLNQIRQAVRKSLLQEPRLDVINSITVRFKENTNNREVEVGAQIIPIDSTEPLNLIYPVFLEA